MIRSTIIGTGSCAPENVVTNHDLEKILDTSDEWITKRTGIRERRIAPEDGKLTDFMYPACKMALEDAGVEPGEIDMLILGSLTPDMIVPSGACSLQAMLGLEKSVGFDVSAACSGFIYGLTIADRFVRTQPEMKILVSGMMKP